LGARMVAAAAAFVGRASTVRLLGVSKYSRITCVERGFAELSRQDDVVDDPVLVCLFRAHLVVAMNDFLRPRSGSRSVAASAHTTGANDPAELAKGSGALPTHVPS
jgi:hypothetical protein